MGVNKKYKGYQAYQYLEKNVDYRGFELVSDKEDRVESYLVPLTDQQEKRAEKIMADNIFISLHEHPCLFPKNMSELFEYKHSGRQPMAYESLSRSCIDAVFDNMMDGSTIITSKSGWKWNDIIHDLGMRLCDIAQQDYVMKCGKVQDIYRAHKEGKLAWIPTLEGAAPIENELDRIDILYGFGIRMMGITYSESNGLGSGLKEKRDGGLTAFGRKAVERMNKVGMAIDVSHTGDQTTLDVIEASKKPVFISHCGARSLWETKRLKPDNIIKKCAEKKGIIAVEAAPHTTITHNHKEHSIESVMEHFEYLVDLIGIDYVSFGPDTLFGDHVGLHHAAREFLSIKSSHEGPSFNEVPYIKGMENPTEASINIIRWLIKHNYSDDDIAKVIGLNTLRVLDEVWS